MPAARRHANLTNTPQKLIDAGLASWAGPEGSDRQLIVRGQANLLEDLKATEDLERIRKLFSDLETKTEVADLLHRAETGDGVRIFIGSENKLFSMSGSSTIVAPFRDGTRRSSARSASSVRRASINARIVPLVDYTARVVSKLMERG